MSQKNTVESLRQWMQNRKTAGEAAREEFAGSLDLPEGVDFSTMSIEEIQAFLASRQKPVQGLE